MKMGNEERHLRLDPRRQLVGTETRELLDRMKTELAETPDVPVVMDLRRATLIDSTGLGLVVNVYKECAVAQRPFCVEIGSDDVQQVFRQMALDRLMEIRFRP
jgi:anti-anti-sigma factor